MFFHVVQHKLVELVFLKLQFRVKPFRQNKNVWNSRNITELVLFFANIFLFILHRYGNIPITYADRGTLPYVEATLLEVQRMTNTGIAYSVLKCSIGLCCIILSLYLHINHNIICVFCIMRKIVVSSFLFQYILNLGLSYLHSGDVRPAHKHKVDHI